MKDKQYRKAKNMSELPYLVCPNHFLLRHCWQKTAWQSFLQDILCLFVKAECFCHFWPSTPVKNLPFRNEIQNLWCLDVLCWYLCVISKQSIAVVLFIWLLTMHFLILWIISNIKSFSMLILFHCCWLQPHTRQTDFFVAPVTLFKGLKKGFFFFFFLLAPLSTTPWAEYRVSTGVQQVKMLFHAQHWPWTC